MIVLGIESSCDETAAALVQPDGKILSNVVSSQTEVHGPYGGVVPELASREHLANVMPVVEQAMAVVDGDWKRVDAIAVTNGPGLVGALLVGVQVAKTIALARSLPIVGVNHLIGHLLAGSLHEGDEGHRPPPMPFVALLASGGHTALYEVRSPLDIEQLGQTRDDAAGEAFDKVAKLLGLGYPGGPRIDKLAAEGDPSGIELPRPLSRRDSLDFSFSGLKSAVARHVREQGVPEQGQARADFCAAFQQTVVSVLVDKAIAACHQQGARTLVISGGVAANRGLRARAREVCDAEGIELFVPPPSVCTDNAAMIAHAGAARLAVAGPDDLDLPVFSRSPILGAKPDSPAMKRYRSSRLPRT